jgi:predicted methyltransferase
MRYGFSTLNHHNCKRCVEPIEHLKKCKRCVEPFQIGITTKVDHILAFYMVHEVPDVDKFLAEMYSILKPGGSFFIIEPAFMYQKRHSKKL